MFRSAILVATIALLQPAAAAAQCHASNDYMDVVRAQAIFAGAAYAADGYELVDVLCGTLREGRDATYSTTVGAGSQVAYVAVCDQDCGDIDLRLLGGGSVLEQDLELDAWPIISYRSRRRQSLRLEVSMYSCSVEPCYFAVAMFSRR